MTCSGVTYPGQPVAQVAGARLVKLPAGLHVDGAARAERDHLEIVSEPVDDPKAPHAIAAKALELVPERLAGARILKQRFEGGPHLALEHGMEAPHERRDLVRDPHNRRGGDTRPYPAAGRYSNSSSRV